MDIQDEAGYLFEKWMNGNREGFLESLDEYERPLSYAILTQVVLLMLDERGDAHPLPEWVEYIESHV